MATYTKTIDPNGGSNYASLNAWEAGEQSLYSSGDIAIADCKRTGATKDTTAVTVAGWTAGVIPKIIVNAAHRHEGKWADQRGDGNYVYTLATDIGTSTSGSLYINNVLNVSVDGLRIAPNYTAAVSDSAGIRVDVYSAGGNTDISNCVIRAFNAATAAHIQGIRFQSSVVARVWNNVIYDFYKSGSAYTKGLNCRTGTHYVYNNTIYNCNYGVFRESGTVIAKNNGVFSCATACFSGSMDAASDYNISSDATAPGTNKATGKTAYTDYFVDPANGDFHLKNTSLALFGLSGADLSGTFTTDAAGVTRTLPFDIGALQYVAAGGTTYDQSVLGSFPAPSGNISSIVAFSQSTTGDFPAPSGSIVKLIGKAVSGSSPAPSGVPSKLITVTRTGTMPAPSGSLQEAVTFRQAVTGIMGSISAVISTVLNPIIEASTNKIKIIGSAFRRIIGG